MTRQLPIGGLVAVGFNPTGSYLLTVTHSGRGVYCAKTWERVARDRGRAYPEDGVCLDIGPIDGQAIQVAELELEHAIEFASPDGTTMLHCESNFIRIDSP